MTILIFITIIWMSALFYSMLLSHTTKFIRFIIGILTFVTSSISWALLYWIYIMDNLQNMYIKSISLHIFIFIFISSILTFIPLIISSYILNLKDDGSKSKKKN
jgi:hypothetical protein